MADWLGRARLAVQRHGMWGLARTTLGRLWRTFVYSHDHVIVFRHNHRRPTTDLNASKADIEVKPIDLHIAHSSARNYPQVLTPPILELFDNTVRDKTERGFMVERDGRLVHYSWMRMTDQIAATSEVGQGCTIRLDAPASLIYHCWTAPEARGRGIYTTVLRQLRELAAREGVDAWIYCSQDNSSSIAGILKAGFEPSHHFHRRRVAGVFTFSAVVPVSEA